MPGLEPKNHKKNSAFNGAETAAIISSSTNRYECAKHKTGWYWAEDQVLACPFVSFHNNQNKTIKKKNTMNKKRDRDEDAAIGYGHSDDVFSCSLCPNRAATQIKRQ